MHNPATKIAILGAGSIGCYLGGLLASQGLEVVFIGRDKLKKAVAQTGLTLTHSENAPLHLSSKDVHVSTSPESLSACHIIMVCTKSQDTEQAAKQIKAFAPSGSHIISCQNGVSNVTILGRVLEEQTHKITATIVPFNVTPTGPNAFHCGTTGALHFEHEIPDILKNAFKATYQDIAIGGNFTGDQWAKLLVNLNNGLNTLSGTTLQKSLIQKPYRKALKLCLTEALEVIENAGISIGNFNGRSPLLLVKILGLPNWAYRIVMKHVVKIDAKARSSMLDDLEVGRPTEIDVLQGEIVSLARQNNQDAKYNARILAAVKQAFSLGHSPNLSGRQILDVLRTEK